MKVKKIIVATEEQNLDVIKVTLLPIEEAIKLTQDILNLKGNWWLRSQGNHDDTVKCVRYDGYEAYTIDAFVGSALGVRPALEIKNLELSNLKVGDELIIKNYKFTVISDRYILCNDLIGYTCFKEDYQTNNANVYKTSDIKKQLEAWWEEMKK